MADPSDLQRELASLDARQGALSPAEEQRRDLIRDALGLPVEGNGEDPGYVLDPESGYYWHPVARHWYEPSTGSYFDEDGRPLGAAPPPLEAAPPPLEAAPPPLEAAPPPIEAAPPPIEAGAPPIEAIHESAGPDPVAAAAALLDEVELELDELVGADEYPPTVAVHRFEARRGRGTRRAAEEQAMFSPQPPSAGRAPEPAPEALATPAPADLPEPGAAVAAVEPHLVGDDDVALVDEPDLADPGELAAEGAAAGVQPPPLPRGATVEILALPGPPSDFEFYAPAVVDEPAFEGAGSAWASALAASPAVPETPERPAASPAARADARPTRPAPVRPPPPVLPSVPGHGAVPPALNAFTPGPAAGVLPPSAPPPPLADESSLHADPPAFADGLFGETPASPTFVAGERQVVIHTREGQALRGSLRDVELQASTLPLETRGGTVRIAADRVRAIFFIVPIGAPLPTPRGRKAKVVFEDGRPVSGLVADYRHDDAGFFLMPLETRGRTDRIYVYRDAIRSIAFA